MSFVPTFFDALTAHLQQEERRRMLASIATTAAPEHWLSLEAAALLDVNRGQFGLAQQLDSDRQNVPRWLVAAERKKVDLWVEDQWGELPPHAIEFKVIHNNKNAHQKIWEIRRDLCKEIPNTEANELTGRWGIVMLVFHQFYDDQAGSYSYQRKFNDYPVMLEAFAHGLQDDDEWYEGAPKLELCAAPALICDMSNANYIDPTKPRSAIHMALVRRKG